MPPLGTGSFEEAKFGHCHEVCLFFTFFKGPAIDIWLPDARS